MRTFLIPVYIIFMCLPIRVFSQTVADSLGASLPAILRSSSVDGVIKAKLETSVESGVMRFNVRNTRIGVRGDIGEYFSYRIQVELSN